MNTRLFLLEILFVGLYSASLYIILLQFFFPFVFPFLSSLSVILFLVGFLKHYLGYTLHIQDYYCNHSASCKQNMSCQKLVASDKYLLETSVAEGVWFCALGIMTMKKTNSTEKNMAILFFIGAVTHILAEFSGIHTEFCKINCRAN